MPALHRPGLKRNGLMSADIILYSFGCVKNILNEF